MRVEGNRVLAGTIVDDILMTGPKAMLESALASISKEFGGGITHPAHEYNQRASVDTKFGVTSQPNRLPSRCPKRYISSRRFST